MKPQTQESAGNPTVLDAQKESQAGKTPGRSPIANSTVELVLQFLPVDTSPDGRRIRHMLSLNGKVLALGTRRASTLPALFADLAALAPEAILARLEEYVTERQRQVHELQRQREKKPVSSATRSAETETQSSLLGTATSAKKSPMSLASISPRPATQTDAVEEPQQLSLF